MFGILTKVWEREGGAMAIEYGLITAHETAEMLNWLVDVHGIEP